MLLRNEPDKTTMAESRTAMLQCLLNKMRANNRKQVIHCLVCVSRISSSLADKRDIGLHYEHMFKSCQTKYQGEGPTGILLIYPQHCLHLIEVPWDVLIEVIQDLLSMDSAKGMLQASRLIVFSSNIQRLFPQWAVRVLNLPALPRGEIYRTQDPLEVTVGDSLESLYALGVHLSKLTQLMVYSLTLTTQHQLKQTMDSLPSKVPKLLLQQDVLEFYLSCQDLTTPSEFLQRYTTPTHIILDRELVWPLPIKLFPYDD